MSENPFEILNVNYSDDLKIIRERFKKLVLKYHPDRKMGNKDKFQKIKDSYAYIYKLKKTQERGNKKQNRTPIGKVGRTDHRKKSCNREKI